MTTKQLTILLAVLVVIGIIAIGVRAAIMPHAATGVPVVSVTVTPPASGSGNPVICTMEAKLCPDGSYVGRQGPNCDFAMCPSGTSSGTSQPNASHTVFTAEFGQNAGSLGLFLTPLEVIEDSRCPVSVRCIQAGTVRVRTEVTNEGTTTEQVFSLAIPRRVGSKTVTLTQVQPTRQTGDKIPPANYVFTFEVDR